MTTEDIEQNENQQSDGDAFGTVDALLCELDAGSFNTRASDSMRELLAKLHQRAQEDSDAAGKLTIDVSFKVARSGKVEAVASFKTNAPAPRSESTTLFVTNRGRLSVRDPRQQRLPFKAVSRSRSGRTVVEIHTPNKD